MRHWSAEFQQLVNLTPSASSAALIIWKTDPDPVDSGVPVTVARCLARFLTTAGQLAFRWQGGASWPSDEATLIRAEPRGVARKLVDRLLHNWPADVVLTRSAAVAANFFEFDWESQGQAGFLIATDANFDNDLRVDLAMRRDWTLFELRSPCRALVVPSVDGDGAMLAAVSDDALEQLISEMKTAFEVDDINVED